MATTDELNDEEQGIRTFLKRRFEKTGMVNALKLIDNGNISEVRDLLNYYREVYEREGRSVTVSPKARTMIDDVTLKQLLWINDRLFEICKRLNDTPAVEVSAQLLPIVNDLTHILLNEEAANVLRRRT